MTLFTIQVDQTYFAYGLGLDTRKKKQKKKKKKKKKTRKERKKKNKKNKKKPRRGQCIAMSRPVRARLLGPLLRGARSTARPEVVNIHMTPVLVYVEHVKGRIGRLKAVDDGIGDHFGCSSSPSPRTMAKYFRSQRTTRRAWAGSSTRDVIAFTQRAVFSNPCRRLARVGKNSDPPARFSSLEPPQPRAIALLPAFLREEHGTRVVL